MWLRRGQLCWKELGPWDKMHWVRNSNAWGICCWPFRTKYHRCKKTGSMRKSFYSIPLKRQVFDRSIMWVALCTNWFSHGRSRSFFKIRSLQLRWTAESKLIRYHWFRDPTPMRNKDIHIHIFTIMQTECERPLQSMRAKQKITQSGIHDMKRGGDPRNAVVTLWYQIIRNKDSGNNLKVY